MNTSNSKTTPQPPIITRQATPISPNIQHYTIGSEHCATYSQHALALVQPATHNNGTAGGREGRRRPQSCTSRHSAKCLPARRSEMPWPHALEPGRSLSRCPAGPGSTPCDRSHRHTPAREAGWRRRGSLVRAAGSGRPRPAPQKRRVRVATVPGRDTQIAHGAAGLPAAAVPGPRRGRHMAGTWPAVPCNIVHVLIR